MQSFASGVHHNSQLDKLRLPLQMGLNETTRSCDFDFRSFNILTQFVKPRESSDIYVVCPGARKYVTIGSRNRKILWSHSIPDSFVGDAEFRERSASQQSA